MPSYVDTVLADRPVLLWTLGESNTASMKDLTRNGNDVEAESAMAGFGVTGPSPAIPSATFMNGAHAASRDSSAIPAVFPLGGAARTLEVWAKPGSGAYCVLSYGLGSNANEHVNFQLGGVGAATAFSDGVNVGNNWGWGTAAPVGVWGHYAMVFAAGTVAFYLNGAWSSGGAMTLNTTAGINRVRSGVRSDDARATAYMVGSLAMAAIYATALSAARIRAHYLAGLGLDLTAPQPRGRRLR